MGILLEARQPLSVEYIERMLKTDRSAFDMTSQLGSILYEDPEVRLLHPSLEGFLFDVSRCHRPQRLFDHGSLNLQFAGYCVKHLQQFLPNQNRRDTAVDCTIRY